jgi:16S rRNA (uracil1498-N3)-methyltransferase
MSIFYHPGDWQINPSQASDALHHHLRVRRIHQDEVFVVFDGQGQIAGAKLHDSSSDKKSYLELFDIHPDTQMESPYPLTLIQGLASNEKMNWLIEKAVELGVTKIVPIISKRSIVRLDEQQAKKKIVHWEQIIIAACEQSGRTVLPTINPPLTLTNFLAKPSESDQSLRVFLSPHTEMKFVSIIKRAPGQGLSFLVGPEGGFSDEENIQIEQAGYIAATLGKRILRTETAGIVAMSAVHSLWGSF